MQGYGDRNVARVLQTTTHPPRRFNTPSHKRRSSRWYFYYRARAIERRATLISIEASGVRRVEAETESNKNTERTPNVDQTIRFKFTEETLAALGYSRAALAMFLNHAESISRRPAVARRG